jgi:membrane protein required for beta-lactamase induction
MEKVITILIVAILEYSTSLSVAVSKLHKLRSDAWLNPSCKCILRGMQRCKITQPVVQMILLLLLLLAVVHLALILSEAVLGEFGEVVFATVLLYYCLGGDSSIAYRTDYIAMHEKCLGIIFWFAVVGPLGAFLYWMVKEINLLDRKNINDEIIYESGIDVFHAILAWVPARITGLLFSLVGNFNSGFSTWLTCIRDPYMQSSEFLNKCGDAACGPDAEENSGILVHRAFFIWIVLAAIIALQL